LRKRQGSRGEGSDGDSTPLKREPLTTSLRSTAGVRGHFSPQELPSTPCLFIEASRGTGGEMEVGVEFCLPCLSEQYCLLLFLLNTNFPSVNSGEGSKSSLQLGYARWQVSSFTSTPKLNAPQNHTTEVVD